METVESMNKISTNKNARTKLISPLDRKCENSFSDVGMKRNGNVPLETPT